MPHSPLYEALMSLLWQLPWVAAAIALIVIAFVKRDGGVWWKLLAAAGGVVLVEQVWNVVRPLVFSGGSVLPFWVWTLPNFLLGLLTLALLAGAAATNRRGTPGHTLPSPQQHHV